MKSITGRDIAEFVGIAAIVASLIFVGLQLKQSQEIALAQQYQSRADAAQALYLAILESEASWQSLDMLWPEQSPAERELTIIVSLWAWTQYDNHYFQYRAGFLDEESWIGLRRRIEQIYAQCDRRFLWDDIQQYLRRSFVAYVGSLNDPCSAP